MEMDWIFFVTVGNGRSVTVVWTYGNIYGNVRSVTVLNSCLVLYIQILGHRLLIWCTSSAMRKMYSKIAYLMYHLLTLHQIVLSSYMCICILRVYFVLQSG